MNVTWTQLPEITFLIRQAQAGDRQALARLFHYTYPHLNRVAASLLRRLGMNKQVSSNDLVHDVFVARLHEISEPVADRSHYLALFTRAMRNQLIDQIRRNSCKKRVPDSARRGFPELVASSLCYEEVMALQRQMEILEKTDARAAQVVYLRYYGGCGWEETAEATGTTVKLVRTDWEFASKWLAERLQSTSSRR